MEYTGIVLCGIYLEFEPPLNQVQYTEFCDTGRLPDGYTVKRI